MAREHGLNETSRSSLTKLVQIKQVKPRLLLLDVLAIKPKSKLEIELEKIGPSISRIIWGIKIESVAVIWLKKYPEFR